MYLANLNPTDINPLQMVDRETLRDEMVARLSGFLALPSPREGYNLTLLGDKGMGKSILTRAVLNEVRVRHATNTVVLIVDCRTQRSWQATLRALGSELVAALSAARRDRLRISDAAFDAARLASELARFDQGELKSAHERTLQFKQALRLNTPQTMAEYLRAELNIDISRDEKTVRSMLGSVRIDEARVSTMMIALMRDLVDEGLKLVLYLDNVDELDHRYLTQAAREGVRRDVEGLLRLVEAPIALVLNMRTYFSGVMGRRMDERCFVDRLDEALLIEMLARRLEREPKEARQEIEQRESQEGVRELARLSSTPLAFLTWFKYLFERGALPLSRQEAAMRDRLRTHYASLYAPLIERIVAAFPTPDAALSREDLLNIAGSDSALNRLSEQQVVLPDDFWSAERFRLDPEFQLFHRFARA